MMDSGPDSGVSMVEEEEDEESAESLVMTVLSALQKLEERIEKSTEVCSFTCYRLIFCLCDDKMNRLLSVRLLPGQRRTRARS